MTVEYAADVWQRELGAIEAQEAEARLQIVEFWEVPVAFDTVGVKLSDGSRKTVDVFRAGSWPRLGERWDEWKQFDQEKS